jgi:MinD-like ATPase involved in chromosome partitioning or flagellar assembly
VTVYAFASAKGSPGVTTTAAAVALSWPAPVVLADVDPAGGDVMWRNRTATGGPLDPDRGLLSLGAAVRRGAAQADLSEHLQPTALGTDVLVGVASPDQLSGLGAAWGQLPAVFDQHRSDVLVDCGRIVPGSAAMPVFAGADVVVLVARPDIAGTAHLRERLRSLRTTLGIGGTGGKPVGIVVRTPYRDTRSAADLQQLLDAEQMGVTVLGIVADEPKAAKVLEGERAGQVRKTLLGRSAAQLAQRLAGAQHAPDLASGR